MAKRGKELAKDRDSRTKKFSPVSKYATTVRTSTVTYLE